MNLSVLKWTKCQIEFVFVNAIVLIFLETLKLLSRPLVYVASNGTVISFCSKLLEPPIIPSTEPEVMIYLMLLSDTDNQFGIRVHP